MVSTSIAVATMVVTDEEDATLKAVRVKLLSQVAVNALTPTVLTGFLLLRFKTMSRMVRGGVRYVTPIKELITIPVTMMPSSGLKLKAG